MKTRDKPLFSQPWLVPVMLVFTMALYAMRQFAFAPAVLDGLHLPGSDDAMRLLMVRDLMAGQGWFDTQQYRVLPPEGISLHWSRLIDAPMAALLGLLDPVLGAERSERWLTVLWPGLLFALFAFLTGRIAQVAFGTPAAVMALIGLWFLQSYHGRYFAFGRLDHHNVQLVLMLAMFGALLRRGRGAAIVSGTLAALSLAVGLETLIFIVFIGLVHVWRYLRSAPDGARDLAAFAGALALASPLFFVLQTPAAQWTTGQCDQLSPPYLALAAAGGLFAAVAYTTRLRVTSFAGRALLSVLLIGLSAGLALPLIAPCFAGPFSDVPEDVRVRVIARIAESAPILTLARDAPAIVMVALLPPVLITVLAALIWWRNRDEGNAPWGLLVLLLLTGIAGACLQMRALIWTHAVMGVGFGAVAAWLINRRWPLPSLLKGVCVTALFLVIFMPQLTLLAPLAMRRVTQEAAQTPPGPQTVVLDRACARGDVLRQLEGLPASVILVPLNLGAGVLVHSSHAVTAAPYHRDARAMLNGLLPFEAEETTMKRVVAETGAEMVLVCDGQVYGTRASIGSRLSGGTAPDWLSPVSGINLPLRVYRVLSAQS